MPTEQITALFSPIHAGSLLFSTEAKHGLRENDYEKGVPTGVHNSSSPITPNLTRRVKSGVNNTPRYATWATAVHPSK